MEHDRLIHVSIGNSRLSKEWIQSEFLWSEFVAKLQMPQRSAETFEEFQKLSKADQGKLKDVGGFVGGTLSGKQRKANAVTGRDLVTLDLDNIASGETDHVIRKIESLNIAYAVYSTRSHAEYRPRLRVVIPLSETITADEYEPVARKIASYVGMELCDPTTFEASRLMYWPSCSKDAQYVFRVTDNGFVDPKALLQLYDDWTDVSTWPQVPGSPDSLRAKTLLAKQQDPTTKHGVVGAFCRTYDILAAIDTFIPNAYEETNSDDRLTYTGGTTVAGAVLYDNGKFLFSHHATDPCSGQLVNAFDLIRLHKFSDLDADAKDGTPVVRMPSYMAMQKLALTDETVAAELNLERVQHASDVFSKIESTEEPAGQDKPTLDDVSWMRTAGLQTGEGGAYKKTVDNIIRILTYDPMLRGKIAIDEFSVRGLALGALPWNASEEKRLWSDTDDAGLQWYLENKYNITGKDKVMNALLLVSEQHRINEVKDYLLSLTWDGVPRVNTVLHDYLGAQQNEYVAAVARKSLAAAVARAMEPGCKYDYVPVLVGPQGIGKSTFLATLGKDWYSDSLQSFEGKEAAEMIQGIWINEVGEMAGYNKSESAVVKQFLSKRDDIYRQAYGRRTAKFPRKCVFFGTSNTYDFLKDLTGNRRFWPVDVGQLPAAKSVWEDLPNEVDQIWAEALHYYRQQEALYFETPELQSLADVEQDSHRETNVKEGLIKAFLDKEVPVNYYKMDLSARRMYWNGTAMAAATMPREKTCALEIWCECLGGDPRYLKRADAMEINQIMSNLAGWSRNRNPQWYGYCGRQKGFSANKKLIL